MLQAVLFPTSSTPLSLKRPLSGFQNLTNSNSLKLTASLSDYPLASRIIVKNLSYSTTEDSLEKEFSIHGQIAEVKLVKDEATMRSKGYAFVQYTSQDHAMLALENMNFKSIDGRMVYVELAKPVSAHRAYPRASGPPKEKSLDQNEPMNT